MATFSADTGTVFISYSHQDAAYLARLQRFLAPHVRSGAIPLWDDTQIKPGDEWKRKIEQALSSARVALLLVSVDFLASEFVTREELPRLLAAAEARGARILPIIVTPCLFRHTTLSRFQAINDPAKPLSGMTQHEQDLVWERVSEAVLDTLAAPVDISPADHQASSDIARKDNRDQWWAADGRVSRLKSAITNETVLALLNLTASQPTEWVSFEQVYRAAGRSSHQARADVRGLTALIKQLFPNNAGGWWPVHYKDGPPLQYRMSEEVARQWNKS